MRVGDPVQRLVAHTHTHTEVYAWVQMSHTFFTPLVLFFFNLKPEQPKTSLCPLKKKQLTAIDVNGALR